MYNNIVDMWYVYILYYVTSYYKANSDQFSHDPPQESLRTILLLLMIIKLVLLFSRVSRLQGSAGNLFYPAHRCQFDTDCQRLIYVPSLRQYLSTYNETLC